MEMNDFKLSCHPPNSPSGSRGRRRGRTPGADQRRSVRPRVSALCSDERESSQLPTERVTGQQHAALDGGGWSPRARPRPQCGPGFGHGARWCPVPPRARPRLPRSQTRFHELAGCQWPLPGPCVSSCPFLCWVLVFLLIYAALYI